MVGDMIRLAITSSGKPTKEVARDWNYSDDALYAAMNNARPIPTQARSKLAKLNLLGCMAVAAETTGIMKLFGYLQVDRHIQNILQMVLKEGREADEAIKSLPQILINKNHPGDLTADDRLVLLTAGKEISDRINSDFNLLAEIDAKYDLNLMQYIAKEKAACVPAQTAFKR
jgi:hypothetical protein